MSSSLLSYQGSIDVTPRLVGETEKQGCGEQAKFESDSTDTKAKVGGGKRATDRQTQTERAVKKKTTAARTDKDGGRLT